MKWRLTSDGVRSCVRGQEPDRHTAEVDLEKLASCTQELTQKSKHWPVCGKDALKLRARSTT